MEIIELMFICSECREQFDTFGECNFHTKKVCRADNIPEVIVKKVGSKPMRLNDGTYNKRRK